MAQQRLVLKVTAGRTVNVGDFQLFMREMEKLEIPASAEIEIVTEADGTVFYYLPIPSRRKSRKVRVPMNNQERAIQRAQDRRDFQADMEQMTSNGHKPKRVVKVTRKALVRVLKREI